MRKYLLSKRAVALLAEIEERAMALRKYPRLDYEEDFLACLQDVTRAFKRGLARLRKKAANDKCESNVYPRMPACGWRTKRNYAWSKFQKYSNVR